MFETEHLRRFIKITDTVYDMLRRDINEDRTRLSSAFKSAVFPVVRPKVFFQPRNVFNEFPEKLTDNHVKEIYAVVEYPCSQENDPLILSFQNYFPAPDDKNKLIIEATETVPSVVRLVRKYKNEIVDGKTAKHFISGWDESIDDNFPFEEMTADRLFTVTIRWRSSQERLDFRKCLSSFYYVPCMPDNYNQQIRVERDGLAVRVCESNFPARAPVCAYFLPTLHNEIKIKVTKTKRGYLEIGWADCIDAGEPMRQPVSVNLLTKEITPCTLQYIVFDQTQDTKLQNNDMIIIKRIRFVRDGHTATDGIAIARARRASDGKGLPYIFIGAIEMGEEMFDMVIFWLRDPGDRLTIVE